MPDCTACSIADYLHPCWCSRRRGALRRTLVIGHLAALQSAGRVVRASTARHVDRDLFRYTSHSQKQETALMAGLPRYP